VGEEPEDYEDAEGEQNAVPEVRYSHRVYDGLK
jgi:hypothetical protein